MIHLVPDDVLCLILHQFTLVQDPDLFIVRKDTDHFRVRINGKIAVDPVCISILLDLFKQDFQKIPADPDLIIDLDRIKESTRQDDGGKSLRIYDTIISHPVLDADHFLIQRLYIKDARIIIGAECTGKRPD